MHHASIRIFDVRTRMFEVLLAIKVFDQRMIWFGSVNELNFKALSCVFVTNYIYETYYQLLIVNLGFK